MKIIPIAIVIFNCCCAFLAIHMTIKQMKTYFNNEDESAISFKDRNDNFQDNDLLATYTICFIDEHRTSLYKRDEWIYYDRDFGSNGYGLGVSRYISKLEGNKVVLKNKSESKGTAIFGPNSNVDGNKYEDQWANNFYYNPIEDLVQCESEEMANHNHLQCKQPIGGVLDNEKDEMNSYMGYQTYDLNTNRPNGYGDLMAIKKDEKVYIIRALQYQDLLMGTNTVFKAEQECHDGTTIKCKMVDIKYSLDDIKSLDFDNKTIDLDLFLLDYRVRTSNGSKIGWPSDLYEGLEINCTLQNIIGKSARGHHDCESGDFEEIIHLTSDPFIKVYQDPTKRCYSPHVDRNINKKDERITLDLSKIDQYFSQSNDGSFGDEKGSAFASMITIHVHAHGQFVRSIGKEIASYSLSDFLGDCGYMRGIFDDSCYGASLTFDTSQVTLLKSRHDANIECDKTLIDEDTLILETVLNHTGIRCIPVYWKSEMKGKFNYPECTTDLQYKMISRITKNLTSYEEIRSNFKPPCRDMIIVMNVEKGPGRYMRKQYYGDNEWAYDPRVYLDINIKHVRERYQVINNMKVYTGESCWAGIGGFIGIFVGVSLMQVPELLREAFNVLIKLKKIV